MLEFVEFAFFCLAILRSLLERLRNENEDKTKTQMTQSFNQYSENETNIWRENILNQFNHVSSSCLRLVFVLSSFSFRSLSIVESSTQFYNFTLSAPTPPIIFER